MTEEPDQTPERPSGDESQAEKSAAVGKMVGCGVALLGIIIPVVATEIQRSFPCPGGCESGWFGMHPLFSLTPLFAIVGLMIALGSRRDRDSDDAEPGASDSSN